MLRGVQLFEVSTKPLSPNYAGDGFMVMTPSVLIYGAKMKKNLIALCLAMASDRKSVV